jgi:SAM-dependent methyltransferase
MYREQGGHCCSSISPKDVLANEQRAPNSVVDARRIVGAIRASLGSPGRLLDVGCGFGFFSAEAIRWGFDVDAVEIASAERAVASAILPRQPIEAEFEDLAESLGPYDAILMSQVLEHAVDVREWVRKAARLLRHGGVICIAVPNFASLLRRVLQTRDPYIDPPVHLNYFSRPNLVALLTSVGLHPFRVDTVSRVRDDVLVRRLPVEGTPVAWLLSEGVRLFQRPLFAATDRVGLGFFLNVYARRSELPSHTAVGAQRRSM